MIEAVTKYATAKGPRRWLLWVYITLGVVAASVVFYFWHRSKQREIIRLKGEASKATVEAEDIRFKMLNATDKARVKELADQANEWQHTADRIRNEAAAHEKEVREKLSQLKELKTWNDLDKYNKQGRS